MFSRIPESGVGQSLAHKCLAYARWPWLRPSLVAHLFLVVDARVEVADGAIEEKFKFEERHRGQPLFERALFAVAADVRPIVKDKDRAISQAGLQIVQAIERGQVDVAIYADIGKFLGYQRFRAAQALLKKSFD